MNIAASSNWPRLIRRYVYQLITLYAVLGLIAIGYNSWQRSSSDVLRRLANDYHLASNYHFLKAIVEIRHIQYQLSHRWVQSTADGAPLPPGLRPDDPFATPVSLHLVRRSIVAALALHREYKDRLFDTLNDKLQRQLSTFEQGAVFVPASNRDDEQLSAVLKEILVPLVQLERLHLIEREVILARLDSMRDRQNLVFMALVFVVLLAGFFSTRRVLKAIGIITAQQVLSEQKVRIFSEAIEQSPISVMLTDTDANLTYVNSHFEEVSGYSADEVSGKNLDFLYFGISTTDAYKDIRDALSKGQSWSGELESRKKDGEVFTEKVFFSPVLDEGDNISRFLLVKEDITVHKQQEEQILYQAHYDSLTGLPNRFLALDRLSQHLSEAQRKREKVALLFLDLDDFKKVNDTMGHDTGDRLLIEASRRLLGVVRSGDTVARLGGDEFVVLLSGLSDSADALPVTDNLINQFREPFKINEREMILTASIGLAIYPDDGDTVSDLLRNADSAMYNAKNQGRNAYAFFTEQMNQEVSRRLAIEEQMHGALDRGEFHLLYQSKIEVSTGHITGAEALLRWDNPVLGGVLPNEFIPIAEQTGLIIPMGEFVLAEAVQMAATWIEDCDHSFRMAVNLSPRQFRDPNLVQFIESIMDKFELTAECLELEITEGVLMSGHAYIDEALDTLHKLGVELAMDDFGTGYSSLSYLRTYPFTTIKIDRSFIEDILDNPADQELVNATIAMASGLGLKVVAEGVETEGQLRYLSAQGCMYAQGYLFGRPIAAEKFTDLLEQQRMQQTKTTG